MNRTLLRNRIARVIWLLRTATQMSQSQLAKKTGTSKTAVSAMERSERLPDVDTLLRLAGALQVSPSVMLQLTELE